MGPITVHSPKKAELLRGTHPACYRDMTCDWPTSTTEMPSNCGPYVGACVCPSFTPVKDLQHSVSKAAAHAVGGVL